MRKTLPILIIGLALIGVFIFLKPEGTQAVVVAARDLPVGHTLTEADLQIAELPEKLSAEAYTDPTEISGQTLRLARSGGDVITPQHIGLTYLLPQPGERGIGIEVNDSGGLAGVLKPGDYVGVTAVLLRAGSEAGTYAKLMVENLRVLYVSPEFQAMDPTLYAADEEQSGFSSAPQRSGTGTVILAVPSEARTVAYDFPFPSLTEDGQEQDDQAQWVYVTDLLPALDHANDVRISLSWQPVQPEAEMTTSGLYIPDLVILPEPTPTATPTQ